MCGHGRVWFGSASNYLPPYIVRDEFESKKEGLEKQLSDLLGETWTVDFDPKAIWPYHNNGYAETSLGDCLRR